MSPVVVLLSRNKTECVRKKKGSRRGGRGCVGGMSCDSRLTHLLLRSRHEQMPRMQPTELQKLLLG